ncbi:MAG: nucleoside-diphosphate kinase [Muribaculaceae bacterium]|nr:nucleoside-diphosphate kinase [Muribaculaceae bacterium]
MEQSLVIIKPSGVQRNLIGKIIDRFQQKGLVISGLKMMKLSEELLREHYAHLVDRPFFPTLMKSMMATPVVVICLKGVDAVAVVRSMVGVTNARNAAPGTIRGDYGMSSQENIVHASDSPENGIIETNRFFKPEEIFDYTPVTISSTYSPDELNS